MFLDEKSQCSKLVMFQFSLQEKKEKMLKYSQNNFFFRERGDRREKEEERNFNVREKHLLVGLVAFHRNPNQELNPTTQACILTGNQTGDLLL